MKYFRRYEPNEEVQIGDLVSTFSDAQNGAAFGTCLVVGVPDGARVYLVRPHAALHGIQSETLAQESHSTERFHVSMAIFLERFVVHVTGPSGTRHNTHYL